MLAYVEKGDILSAIPIRNWLLAQMDARGGWRSSQDSIIALMALSLMSIKTGKLDESSALAIELNVAGKFHQQLSINSRTAIITRRFEVRDELVIKRSFVHKLFLDRFRCLRHYKFNLWVTERRWSRYACRYICMSYQFLKSVCFRLQSPTTFLFWRRSCRFK